MKTIQYRRGIVLGLVFLLLNITVTNCNTITEQYNQEYSFLQQSIQTLQNFKDSLQLQLDELTADRQGILAQQRQSCHFVEWINNKTSANQNYAMNLLDGRCQEHTSFLEFLQNGRITLRMIQFLRVALNDFSFTQMGAVTKIFSDFSQGPANKLGNTEALKMMFVELDSIKKNKFDSISLLDKIQQRTVLVDESKEDFELNQWEDREYDSNSEERQQLISLLDEFEAFLNREIDRREDSEVTSNEQVALFVNRLNEENQNLYDHLVVQQENCDQDTTDLDNFDTEYSELVQQINDLDLQIAERNQLLTPFYALSGSMFPSEVPSVDPVQVDPVQVDPVQVNPVQAGQADPVQVNPDATLEQQPQIQMLSSSEFPQEQSQVQFLSARVSKTQVQVPSIDPVQVEALSPTLEQQPKTEMLSSTEFPQEQRQIQFLSAYVSKKTHKIDDHGSQDDHGQNEHLQLLQIAQNNTSNDQTDDEQQMSAAIEQQNDESEQIPSNDQTGDIQQIQINAQQKNGKQIKLNIH